MSHIIPGQEAGKQNDLYYRREEEDREHAVKCFTRAYKRMLNPRVWHKLCGALSAEFKLVDGTDDPHRLAMEGDHYRIDITGPGPRAGDGYDWVMVEAVEVHADPDAEQESAAMRLRTCKNPKGNTQDTAHFFTDAATSTFIISRMGNAVTASYHGRNEQPNTETQNSIDNLRNGAVASGAMAALSEAQWQTLITEFLQPEIGGMPE
jgi:hypothetical protein